MPNYGSELMCLDSPPDRCLGICKKTNEKCKNKRRFMKPFCHLHKRQRIVNAEYIKLYYQNIDTEKQRIFDENKAILDEKRYQIQLNNTCCICYENGIQEKIQRPYCKNKHNNTFIHYTCEKKWRIRSNKCPICRCLYPSKN